MVFDSDIKIVIKKLKKFLNTELGLIDGITIQRTRDIFSRHILFTLSQMVCNGVGYQKAVTGMITKKYISKEICYKSINKKVLEGKYGELFSSLTHKLIQKFFYDDKKSERFFAVDGSKINMSVKLKDKNFYTPGNGNYCQGLLSTIYDIESQFPYFYNLNSNLNERTAFYNQGLKITKNECKDIFIFDRGYYSIDIVQKMKELNFDFIFRLKKSSKFVLFFDKNNTEDYLTTIDNSTIRIIKYRINLRNYYLITSLIDSTKYTSENLKELYHQRWSVEEYYKKIKQKLKCKTFHSNKLEGIKTEVAIQQFNMVLAQVFIKLLRKVPNVKINHTITHDIIINDILPLLLFDKFENLYLREITRLLGIVGKIKVTVRPNRKYERSQRFSSNKFPNKKKKNIPNG